VCRHGLGRLQVGYWVGWGCEPQMRDRLQANHEHFNCNLGLRMFTGVLRMFYGCFTGILRV
jgi:hypothetical protein